MPALNALAAALAATEVHGEFPVDRRAGNFGLELLGGAGFDERFLVAMGTGVGEFRFVALVNLVGRRRRAMAVSPVLFAGFAAGCFGLGFGRTFAERRGLTLAGAKGLFELPGQFGVLCFERFDSLAEFAASRTRGAIHSAMLAAQRRFSCVSLPKGAVNKYQRAIALDKSNNKKDFKRIAMLSESAKEWASLPLSPSKLNELGAYLESVSDQLEYEKNLSFTRLWMADNKIDKPDQVLSAFAQKGAHTDFQVLYNITR